MKDVQHGDQKECPCLWQENHRLGGAGPVTCALHWEPASTAPSRHQEGTKLLWHPGGIKTSETSGERGTKGNRKVSAGQAGSWVICLLFCGNLCLLFSAEQEPGLPATYSKKVMGSLDFLGPGGDGILIRRQTLLQAAQCSSTVCNTETHTSCVHPTNTMPRIYI